MLQRSRLAPGTTSTGSSNAGTRLSVGAAAVLTALLIGLQRTTVTRGRSVRSERAAMEQPRINIRHAAPKGIYALLTVHQHLSNSGLEAELLDIVYLRASQINGCAYCVDMHWQDARAAGVPEQKLSLVPVWREAPMFTPRERAALEWTESVTLVAQTRVPDDVYAKARDYFNETELANLTIAIGLINTWNRLNVAFRNPAGSYQPGQYATAQQHQ